MAWWGLGADLGTPFGVAVVAREAGQFDVLEVAGERPAPSSVLGQEGEPLIDPLAARLELFITQGRRRSGGDDPGQLVFAHPAAWGQNELAVLRQAAQQVVPAVPVRLVSSPVAAVVEVASDHEFASGAKIAICDLGDGTLAAAVLQVADPQATGRAGADSDAPGFTVLATAQGASGLGGEDDDERGVAVLGRALESAGVRAEALIGIWLIGAASRIPTISLAMAAKYGVEIHTGDAPELTVARGAARLTMTGRGAGSAAEPMVRPPGVSLDKAAAAVDEATARMYTEEARAADQYEHGVASTPSEPPPAAPSPAAPSPAAAGEYPGYGPAGYPGYAPSPASGPPMSPGQAPSEYPGYVGPGYPGPGYAGPGYDRTAYDQAGYDQAGYGTAGYGQQPGYGQGYPQPGYPGYGQATGGPGHPGYGDPYGTAILAGPPDPERERRKRVLAAVAAAVVVAVIATGGILVAQGKLFGGSGHTTAGDRSTDNSGSTDTGGSTDNSGSTDSGGGTDPGGSTDVDPSNSTNVSSQASVTADNTAVDRVDAAGNPTSYAASNTTDGDLETAWRQDGSGAGGRLVYRFDSPTTITSVGMTNGYTKIDSASGADRYHQERRILQVTWSFDDGSAKTQYLTDDDTAVQSMDITPVQTTSVTLTIDTVTDPGDTDFDYTAISEVEIYGQ